MAVKGPENVASTEIGYAWPYEEPRKFEWHLRYFQRSGISSSVMKPASMQSALAL